MLDGPFDLACPITDLVSVISVVVTGAPQPVLFAVYDIAKSTLWLQFADLSFRLFIDVPRRVVQRPVPGPVRWDRLSRFAQPLLYERSICPLLTEDGYPVILSGGFTPTGPTEIVTPPSSSWFTLEDGSGTWMLEDGSGMWVWG